MQRVLNDIVAVPRRPLEAPAPVVIEPEPPTKNRFKNLVLTIVSCLGTLAFFIVTLIAAGVLALYAVVYLWIGGWTVAEKMGVVQYETNEQWQNVNSNSHTTPMLKLRY